jgi:hypothetical protein
MIWTGERIAACLLTAVVVVLEDDSRLWVVGGAPTLGRPWDS